MRSILDTQLKIFIRENIAKDPAEIALHYTGKTEIPLKLAAEQIKSRQKAKKKLPTWFQNYDLIFPPAISIEQCSSELAASFKARFYEGDRVLDLTGGSAVDTVAFGHTFSQLTYVEPDEHLCELAKHNLAVLGVGHAQVIQSTAEAFLESDEQDYDLIYIDPSRRDELRNRVYALDDCYPNVIQLLPSLLSRSKRILIKASPMIDIKQALTQLTKVVKVQALAIDNEMKELLFHIEVDDEEGPIIEAWNISEEKEEQVFSFTYKAEQHANIGYSQPLSYLYDMNVAMMKAGAFKSVAEEYGLFKLGAHTHLYTSDELIGDFPGRVFEIESQLKSSKKHFRNRFDKDKVNIATRNYPMSTTDIKKKYSLQDGGDKYAFFCTIEESDRTCLVCRRIQ